ncbi:hypothetical protein DPMN_179467 [Dreissena polymorpha]|uniref:Uncharacterized protein n=1 Tax=Dreissena polymorpha TaxID=45954 RepID=A0A9D4ECE7_DREPO|nr:hypothetical protein DPMN_179467 [Dreissena polymorpha]
MGPTNHGGDVEPTDHFAEDILGIIDSSHILYREEISQDLSGPEQAGCELLQLTQTTIFPIWRSQTWFSMMMTILSDFPVRLPKHRDLLTLPHNGQEHPLAKKIIMGAASQGLLPETANTIIQSWRPGTRKQYDLQRVLPQALDARELFKPFVN